MALVDRNIHSHVIFCYLANATNTADNARNLSNYYYRYSNSVLVGMMDRFDSNAGFLLHIGPDSKCESFEVSSVPGFIADENATRLTLQYQWFNRNPSVVTGLKENIVSFLDNASKSDIYITAAFASMMGFFGTVLGKLFGIDTSDIDTFRKTIAFIAYIFQQGKAIVQEKDILSFGGMDIPSNQFTFRKTYITLAYADNLTSIDMAISDAMALRLFPDIMGFVIESDETGEAKGSNMVQLVASMIVAVFLDSVKMISCNSAYNTKYRDFNVTLFSREKFEERAKKLALLEGQGNAYSTISISLPIQNQQNAGQKYIVSSGVKIDLCPYEMADYYNESEFETHMQPEVLKHLLGLSNDAQIDSAAETKMEFKHSLAAILNQYKYPILLYNCFPPSPAQAAITVAGEVIGNKVTDLTKDTFLEKAGTWVGKTIKKVGQKTSEVIQAGTDAIRDTICFEEPLKLDNYLKYMYNEALLVPFMLLTNIEDYMNEKKKEENMENLYKSYETYKKDIENHLKNLGIQEIKSTNTYDLKTSLSEFQNLMKEAIKYINEKMLVNGTTYVIENEVVGGDRMQVAIQINYGRVMREHGLPYNFTEAAPILLSVIQKADALQFQKAQHNVIQFLHKFGIMIVKPPGGYHFIPDYRAIVGALIHGRPCIQMDTGFEELQSITYKIAYYGFTYRNIFRNILGVVDAGSMINSTHISYMIPSQIVLTSSDNFTYAPLPTQYAEAAVPTWTKMELSFTPMNNFIFFFGNYANLYDLYDGLGLDKIFSNKSQNTTTQSS